MSSNLEDNIGTTRNAPSQWAGHIPRGNLTDEIKMCMPTWHALTIRMFVNPNLFYNEG